MKDLSDAVEYRCFFNRLEIPQVPSPGPLTDRERVV